MPVFLKKKGAPRRIPAAPRMSRLRGCKKGFQSMDSSCHSTYFRQSRSSHPPVHTSRKGLWRPGLPSSQTREAERASASIRLPPGDRRNRRHAPASLTAKPWSKKNRQGVAAPDGDGGNRPFGHQRQQRQNPAEGDAGEQQPLLRSEAPSGDGIGHRAIEHLRGEEALPQHGPEGDEHPGQGERPFFLPGPIQALGKPAGSGEVISGQEKREEAEEAACGEIIAKLGYIAAHQGATAASTARGRSRGGTLSNSGSSSR